MMNGLCLVCVFLVGSLTVTHARFGAKENDRLNLVDAAAMPTVALVVPATLGDLRNRFPALAKSVALQTIAPDEFVMLVSGTGKYAAPTGSAPWPRACQALADFYGITAGHPWPACVPAEAREWWVQSQCVESPTSAAAPGCVPLQLESTASCEAVKTAVAALLAQAYACANKPAAMVPRVTTLCRVPLLNQALARKEASLAATSDVLSYIDADDTLLPRRIEATKRVFATHRPKLFMHAFYPRAGGAGPDYAEPASPAGQQQYDAAMAAPWDGLRVYDHHDATHSLRDWIHADFHHGHATVSAQVMRDVPDLWDRASTSHCPGGGCMGEDSIFVRHVLDHYGRKADTAIFLPAPLSAYTPRAGQQKPPPAPAVWGCFLSFDPAAACATTTLAGSACWFENAGAGAGMAADGAAVAAHAGGGMA
eukprot:g391.t1